MAVVVVTGANRGLGSVTACAFARGGHRVFGTVRSDGAADELATLADRGGVHIEPIHLDLVDDESVARAIATIRSLAGRLDVVVANAGIGWAGAVELTPDAVAHEIFEANTFGLLRLIRHVLPVMRDQHSGTILAITSLAGAVPAPGMGVYAASKQAAAAIMEALWLEAAPFGVHVACVEPGPFRTAISAAFNADAHDGCETTPYRTLLGELRSRRARRLETAEDPEHFAAAVVRAALDPQPPLHVPVGRIARDELGRSGADRLSYLRQLRQEIAANATDVSG